jgi:hypothetical protein
MFSMFVFSIQEFFICYFYCQKMAFVCEFQHTPLWKLMIFSRFLKGKRFCEHVPNSPKNKNLKRLIPYLLEKVVFLDPKRLLSPSNMGKENFFFNFECYDLANGKGNESVRFGRHIDIEVS